MIGVYRCPPWPYMHRPLPKATPRPILKPLCPSRKGNGPFTMTMTMSIFYILDHHILTHLIQMSIHIP